MQVKPTELARHLGSGLAPVYLITGDDALLVQEACDAVLAATRQHGYEERSVLYAENNFNWNDVVQDAASMSLFAERRVIDPGAGQLEMADLITFDFINPVEYTRYSPRIVEPASERKPLWWILRELAQRTGIESGLPEGIDDDDDILRMMMATARASFDEVRSCPTAVVSKGRTYEWVHRHLPGGRWNLAPQDLIEQLGRAEASRDQWVLVPHRQRYKLNSQMSDGLARPRRPDRAALSIHPDDAAGLGVADGNMVVIESAAGTITAPAHLDASYRRGVVSLPHGFADVNVNVLTDASKTDPLSGMVILSAFPVSLRRDERHGAGVRAPR
jgi:anaerobic selenocysteine-containing dehydrogenase